MRFLSAVTIVLDFRLNLIVSYSTTAVFFVTSEKIDSFYVSDILIGNIFVRKRMN